MSSHRNPPSPPPPPASPADAPLERDLLLVLEEAALAATPPVAAHCLIAGRAVSAEEAHQRAVEIITQARAPAIVGLEHLSLEAQRQAVALAEALHARLLLEDSGCLPQAVTQTATLGHVLTSDLWVWVAPPGGGQAAEAVVAWLQTRRGPATQLEVAGDLATVLALRDDLPQPLRQARRIAVLLAPGLDPRVVLQWHKLAAKVQNLVRMAVVQLPRQGAGNRRGAIEVVAWQTGFSLEQGGVDFADGLPRPCPGLTRLLAVGALDLLLDFRPKSEQAARNAICTRICISGEPCPDAAVCLVVPPVRLGMEGQVMRFDGVVLRLCPPEELGEPDAQALLLAELRRRCVGEKA